jgi:molecular chaperone DnaK (HSP70)
MYGSKNRLKINDQRYIVGIDLGTTNSAVSYVDLQIEERSRRTEIFSIPQLTGPGEVSNLQILPSFLYIPGEYDIAKEALAMPWPTPEDHFAGAFARDHGSKVPARLVASAKSWMCHTNADRHGNILPWGADNEVAKVSPIQASAFYLTHIRKAWNQAHQSDDAVLEDQVIIITIPASFDEVARELTVEAAVMAGLPGVILLEEPLAAFYSWLIPHESDWNQHVRPNELILVCDVGGGTTDFTLIYLRDADGRLGFERIAVGNHLILGGDNIDLTLARRIEMQLAKQKISLQGDRWKTLCHQSRQAKERILGGVSEQEKITILGEGGKLIGGTLTATLNRQDIEETVLEGFFPLVSPNNKKKPNRRKGITEFGLPYEQEPAITRHLGWFLEQHGADVAKYLGKTRPVPDLILFNGGSVKPSVIQERVLRSIVSWFDLADNDLPRILANPDPDLAVSLGAAYYGLVKTGRGVKVGSGSPRSYYLEVAAQGNNDQRQAICLVERGLEEGSEIELQDHKFEVLANQPVIFNLYSSNYRSGDRQGDLIVIDDSLTSLEPLETIIHYGRKGVKTQLPIHLVASYTEVGTLELWCRSLTSDHRWKLHFQLRNISSLAKVADLDVFDTDLVTEARTLIRKKFSDPTSGQHLASVVKNITKLVDRPRKEWPLTFIRALADELLELEKVRRHTHEHESRWLNLLGYCMRPGMADGADPLRMKTLWRLFSQGPVHASKIQVRSEWWIMWRRVAAGLTRAQQHHFVQEVALLLRGKKRMYGQTPPQERLEMWMAIANMEYLHTKEKIRLGRILLAELKPKQSKPQHLWSLSRIGARELLYGPVDRVVPPGEVGDWLTPLINTNWRDLKPVTAALAQLARKTGDRTRDLDPNTIHRLILWMSHDSKNQKMMEANIRYLQDVIPMSAQEENVIFGESLPTGIMLHTKERQSPP